MNKASALFGFIAGVAAVSILAVMVLRAEPRDVIATDPPHRFELAALRALDLVRPGGRLVQDGRVYRRCEDSRGRLVGNDSEQGDQHEGRFVDYRPDGSKFTWGGARWCWRS